MVDMKLLGEKILVRPHMKTKTDGGIIIPDTVQKVYPDGEVLAIGTWIPEETGCKELKVGDYIKWMPHAGTWTQVKDEMLMIIRPNDVIGIITKESLAFLDETKSVLIS